MEKSEIETNRQKSLEYLRARIKAIREETIMLSQKKVTKKRTLISQLKSIKT